MRLNRFLALAEHIPHLVFVLDGSGTPLFVNRRWMEYTGATLEELRLRDWATLGHPDEAPLFYERWVHSFRTGDPFECELRVRGRDGAWRWFLARAEPAHNDQGQVSEWFGTLTDIEQQKSDAARELGAVRIRDEFLAVASHELKTPLTALKLQLGLMANDLAPLGTTSPGIPKIRARLDSAQRQVARLTSLNDTLLDVSRLAAQRVLMSPCEMNLSDMARETAERFAPEMSRSGCPLLLDVEDGVVGFWDPVRLEQALSNLLTNAMKYGAGRPVALALSTRDDEVLLSVADQGIGISAGDISRIFGKFERAVSPNDYGGLGLGLFIARQIVEAIGGGISVTSTLGAGFTFTLRLPRTGAPKDSARPSGSSRPGSSASNGVARANGPPDQPAA